MLKLLDEESDDVLGNILVPCGMSSPNPGIKHWGILCLST